MSDEINKSIDAVFSGLLSMGDKDNADAYNAVANTLLVIKARDHAVSGNYESFDFEYLHLQEQVVDGLLESVTDNNELQFLMKHGAFVERHFNKMIVNFEGSPYCSDKSSTIMSRLIRFHQTGTEIAFNYDQDVTYHLPKKVFTTHTEIIKFAESLHHFFYGNPQKYLESVLEITNKQVTV
jgi:hypothetical protein